MNNQEYLNSIKPGAIEGWHKYKIAPSITGAQAVLESGWGSSKLAKPPYNNNFGIKAGDDWTGRKITMSTREYINGKWITINDDFRAYDTLSESIADHGAFFTNTEWRKDNYREIIGQIDYKKAAISLRKAGYATDPSYSQKLINIIEQNDLQSWDQEALKGETTKIDTPQTIPVSTDANITASGGKKKIVGGSISSDARNGISQFTLSVIGDSLGVGTEPFLKQYPWARQSYDNYGSRQWTHETDVYNGITALNNMKNAGNLNNNVVFILGTNRGVDASEIDEAVSICGRDRNLILVDTTSEVNHRTKVSSEYEKAASRHNNVFYANWSSYSRANIGAWYYADGANGTRIHMNPTGYQKHADFIVQAVYEANQIIFETSVKVDPIKPSTETVNIYDIEYDDGVFTSPKGDSSIYNKALNDQLGFRARKGRIMWIERKYSGSETDSASLLNAALEKMKEASVPAAQYTVNMRYLPDNISIGDTGVFIDHEFDPPLYIQARVLAMTTSESNPANNTVTIGNVVEVTPQPKSDLLSIQKELQDTREMSLAEYWKVKPVTLQVTTSNGLVLKPKNNETFAQLVTKYNQEHVLKNGSLLVDMRNAKDKNATITITGSIKNNYIDSVDEIVNNINYDDYNNVNFDDGPIDVNSNPQGQDVVDINDYNNIRKLIVDSFDVEFLNVDGNVVGSEKVYVYEDSTFVSKITNPGQYINKIRILSPRDCTFDNISAIDESIKLTDTVESTSVYVKVFQKEKEVTHEFKNFKWTRVSQNTRLDNEWNDVNKWNESNNIDLDVKDVFGNESTFICRVYDDEYNFVSATSITLAVSTNGKSAYDVWIEAGNEGSEEDYLSSLKGEDGKDGMSEEEAQTIKQQVEEALTGAEQAKEKAQSAYKNAVADAKAEAERLDNERQLIIDGKFEEVNKANEALEQSIATAEQNAQDALTKAGASEDLAKTAKEASESAIANLGTVQTELTGVKTQASDSLIKAQKALDATGTLSTQVKSYEETVDGYKSEVANYSRTNETLTAKVKTYEATVDGYSQSLTRVEGKVDNLEIGGRNLLYNSGNFTDSYDGWVNNGGGISIDTTNKYAGYNTIKTTFGHGISSNKWYRLENNVVYTYSAVIKSDVAFPHSYSVPLHYWSGFNEVNQGKITFIGGDTSYTNSDLGKFKKLWVTFKLIDDADSFKPYVYGGSIIPSGTINIAYIKLEKGNKPTDWSPSAEDMVNNSDFTTYQNQVKSTTDEHTRRLTALDGTGGRVSKVEQTATQIQTSLSSYAKTAYVDTQITNKAGEITTQLTSLKGDFDNLQIGGTNLWSNSTAEGSFNKWNVGDGTKTLDRGFLWNGKPTIKFVKGNSASSGLSNGSVRDKLPPNSKFTYSFMIYSSVSINPSNNQLTHMQVVGTGSTSLHREQNMVYKPATIPANKWTKVSVTFETPDAITQGETFTFISYLWYLPYGGTFYFADFMLEFGNKATDWSPAPEDMVTQTEFQTVKETVNLYERTIGTTEANIKSNIAKITMTDSLFQTEVSKNTDVTNTKSKVTQLSNSWALTLKSGNDIKTAINATTDGIRLKGSLITLDGQVNMTSSFIVPEGNIGNLSAKKITSGTIDTARLNSADIVTKGLTSNVVKSTHILADNALFDKLFTNDLATQKLATKQAWIKTGMIANAQIGTAQIGTIDASNGKIVNIDAQYITANHAKLVSAGFQGLNSNMHIDGGAIRIQNRDGDFATMNAIPEFRSQDSAGTSAILGKGRSQYYSGNQSRFYIGSSLNGDEYNGKTVHGVHISKNQTWGIYRQSDAFGGTPAQYYKTPAGWGAVQVIEELMRTGKIVNNFSQASALIRGLNGWGNSFPVLQPGDMVMYKAAVSGNSSGIERIWTMGTSSNGATRTYSHVHHVFEGGTTGVSDARLKHDIKPTDIKALDHIADLSFKQFKWNRNDVLEPLGLIAQESGILRVPDEEMEGIDIQRAMMLALKGIQELSQKVQELEEQNETLRTNNRGTSY